MKNYYTLLLILSIICLTSHAGTYQGGVSEKGYNTSTGRIIDKASGKGISGAKISIPKNKYTTKTDRNGYFELDTSINDTSIMSVKKDKYKPFSMSINSKDLSEPLIVGIEKSNSYDLSVDSEMHHLGDDNYSKLSANAGEFRTEAEGPFFTKKFILKNLNYSMPIYIVIGSIVGIDTLMARTIGQNKVPNSYASAPEVYFNGNKISEIQINGDGQKIKIPPALIRKNKINEVTIKTGRNLMQTSYIDYDDIEFMNLSIEN